MIILPQKFISTDLGRIQDLVTGDSDKHPPTLSYCCWTSRFFTIKSRVWCFTLGVSSEPPEPSLDPPQLKKWVCDYTTGKIYQHWLTACDCDCLRKQRNCVRHYIQRQKFANTNKLNLWLHNVKSPRTQRNWVCDYTTAKVYQHWPTL